MPLVSDVPPAIIEHVCTVLDAHPLPRTTLTRYDRSGSKLRHQKILREYAHILPLDASTHERPISWAANAARTKAELPDIINVLLDELVRYRYELPPLATLSRVASQARSHLNETVYLAFSEALNEPLRTRLEPAWLLLARSPAQGISARLEHQFFFRISGLNRYWRKLYESRPTLH